MTLSEVEPPGRRCLERWVAGGLVAAFVLLNGALLALKGVQLGGDTSRYLDGARALLAGRPLGGYTWTYRGYMAVVAFWQEMGAGLPGVVGFQIVLAAVAGVAVAALGARLGGLLAGLIGAAFILVNPEVAQWHTYILTDSLYISAVAIVTFVVWRAAEHGGRWYGLALLVLLPAATLRPTALLLLPVAAAFWGVRGVVTRDWIGIALGVIGAVGAVLLVVSPRVQDTAAQLPGTTLRSGRVIYQEPAFRMEMPREEMPRSTGWLADLRYVRRHPGPTLTLGARRIAVELAHVRPFYRVRHNRADRGRDRASLRAGAHRGRRDVAPPPDAPAPGSHRRPSALRGRDARGLRRALSPARPRSASGPRGRGRRQPDQGDERSHGRGGAVRHAAVLIAPGEGSRR